MKNNNNNNIGNNSSHWASMQEQFNPSQGFMLPQQQQQSAAVNAFHSYSGPPNQRYPPPMPLPRPGEFEQFQMVGPVGISCPIPPRPPKTLKDCAPPPGPCIPQYQPPCGLNNIQVPCRYNSFIPVFVNHFHALKKVLDWTLAMKTTHTLGAIAFVETYPIWADLHRNICHQRKEFFNHGVYAAAYEGACLVQAIVRPTVVQLNDRIMGSWIKALVDISYFLVEHMESLLMNNVGLDDKLNASIASSLALIHSILPITKEARSFSDQLGSYIIMVASYISDVIGNVSSNICINTTQRVIAQAESTGIILDSILINGIIPPPSSSSSKEKEIKTIPATDEKDSKPKSVGKKSVAILNDDEEEEEKQQGQEEKEEDQNEEEKSSKAFVNETNDEDKTSSNSETRYRMKSHDKSMNRTKSTIFTTDSFSRWH